MIVVLHGAPGDPSAKNQTEISAFLETINVRVAAYGGIDLARSLGFDAVTMFSPTGPSPTEHELEYKFQWCDGVTYHYGFTGKIDGV